MSWFDIWFCDHCGRRDHACPCWWLNFEDWIQRVWKYLWKDCEL